VCADCVVLEWPALIPELQQTIDLDRVSNRLFYGLLALLVSFTVVNSFVMVLFERTREFGMLLAIGMRPGGIVGMLLLEGVWLAVLGIALGLALAVPVVAWVAEVGLPLGEAGGEMLRRFHMPDRMYTALDVDAFVPPSLIMLFATILAALLPSLRVRRLRPVEALRAD
jgi:ABC-type lipoprotein release transport system permease subunit